NAGTAPVLGPWADTVYLSADDTFGAGDLFLGQLSQTGPLAPGAQISGRLAVTLPVSAKGSQFLLLRTDANQQVIELAGETNNLVARPLQVQLAPFADLAVGEVSAPAFVIGDPAQVTVSWTVTNLGTGAGTVDTWVDRVIASTDGVAGNADDVVLR